MITISRLLWATCVVSLVVLATPARAQSAIAGTVKDTSGAVMPGVSVEASSPVLIEKVRTTVTDENGQYRIIDLRPGSYSLTFTLTGFNTIKRELELPVGGSRAMQQTYFAIRGTNREQTIVTVDGQVTNGLMFDGGVQAYHNEAMVQETVFRTAGGNAEAISGGLNLNLIPKDGGNQFAGTGYGYYSPSAWQGNNLTDNLRHNGVSSVDKIDRFYEFAIPRPHRSCGTRPCS